MITLNYTFNFEKDSDDGNISCDMTVTNEDTETMVYVLEIKALVDVFTNSKDDFLKMTQEDLKREIRKIVVSELFEAAMKQTKKE